jgi:predicted transcriptional regulator
MKALEEDTKWVLGVDRRLVVIRALDTDGAFSASEVAERTGRSVQNVSRAMDEMETMGLIECLTPEKHSWKRYILTERGKKVIHDLKGRKMIH